MRRWWRRVQESQGPRVPRSRGPKVLGSQGPRYLKITFKYELDSKEGPSCYVPELAYIYIFRTKENSMQFESDVSLPSLTGSTLVVSCVSVGNVIIIIIIINIFQIDSDIKQAEKLKSREMKAG